MIRGARNKRKKSKDVGGGATASGPSTSVRQAGFGRVSGAREGKKAARRKSSASHLADTSMKEHMMENDDALKHELSRLEASGSKVRTTNIRSDPELLLYATLTRDVPIMICSGRTRWASVCFLP